MGQRERENRDLSQQLFEHGQQRTELQSRLMMAEQDLADSRAKYRDALQRLRALEEENQVLKRERYGHFQPMDSIPL